MSVVLKKVVVLGGGPGGYVAAIRAAQLGASVVLVEKELIGGTCLNRGCVPTKVLLQAASILNEAQNAEKWGIKIGPPHLDWGALMRKKQDVVEYFVSGVSSLLKLNGVETICGRGRLVSERALEVTSVEGTILKLSFDALVLATGSVSVVPPVPGFELSGVLNSDGALSLSSCPESLLLVGGGVIGIELGASFASFGTKVSIVEMLPEILPSYDVELASALRKLQEEKGVEIVTSCTVSRVSKEGDRFRVSLEGSDLKTLEVEKVVVCVGRKPNTASLGLEEVGLRLERGRVVVDEHMESSVPGIFAVGDCASPVMLAHVASAEGEIAAENALGGQVKMHYGAVPSGVYTMPELAGVGLSENEARKRGLSVKVGRFPLTGNGKAVICDQYRGSVKVVVDAETGEIFGVQVLGPRAAEVVMEAALAMRSEATVDELMATVHAHPTVSEGLREAALDVVGRAIHIPPTARKS